MRLLIAEDDPKLLKSLLHIFKINHYLADGVTNGIDAFQYAMTKNYDGMVLDIMMPGMDGVEVLKKLRKQHILIPALFLTAKAEVEQRIAGLDAGADDYLSKPFSPAELLARVRAMLRRKENFVPDILSFEGLLLNRSTCQISCNENVQVLSQKEFQIMELLMQCPRFVVTTEQFISHIWGWESEIDVSTVWVHISNIRKKLQKIQAPVEIRFMRNTGYILEAAK